LTCMNMFGRLYHASSCLMQDFERFLATRGPTVADPMCYVQSSWLPLFDCDPSNAKFSTNELCVKYRKSCRDACGPNAGMLPNLTCVLM